MEAAWRRRGGGRGGSVVEEWGRHGAECSGVGSVWGQRGSGVEAVWKLSAAAWRRRGCGVEAA